MPNYEITAPDGHTYQVTAPEGASQADVLNYVQQQHAAAPPRQVGTGEAAVRAVGNAATFNLAPNITAAAQAALPAIDPFLQKHLPFLGTGDDSHAPTFSQRYDENLAAQRASDKAAQAQHPVASLASSVVGGMANPVARLLPVPTSIGGTAAQGAGLGAAYGFGGAEGGLENRAKSALGGAALGGLTGAAFGGISKALAGAQKSPAAQALEAEGVNPTVGQMLGGSAQRAEDALTSTPILGDAIKNRQLDAIKDFNRADYNRVLDPLGVQYPTNAPVGNDGIAKVGEYIDKAYKQAFTGAKITDNPQMQQTLQSIVADADNVLPPERVSLLQKNINRLLTSKFDPQTGELNSDMLQTAKNWFAEQSRAGSSASQDERNLASAYGQVLNTIKGEVANSDPARADMLKAADTAYANYVRTLGAGNSTAASAKGGLFSPNQLGMAAKAADQSAHKGAFAKGQALGQDLAQLGQQVLTPTVPDSGTPFRTLMHNPATLLTAPLSLPTLGAASAGYSKTGQDVIKALLFGAPQTRAALSQVPPHMLPGALGLIGSQSSQ